MNEELNDKTVISIIIGTILIIFMLVFTFLPSKNELSPSIQWKDVPAQRPSVDQFEI